MSSGSNRHLQPVLKVDDLAVSLARRTVLDIEHFQIDRAEFTILTGANGAGKTTLLKVLAGLTVARRGRFECLGQPLKPRAAARFCLGRHVYLHQTPFMFDATVADNVAYGLRRRNRGQIALDIQAALEWADLAHLSERHASELSTGEKQRVALTRARILAPQVLLLDEITSNMDRRSRERTYALIQDLKRSGATVVFASHEYEELEAFADRRLNLARGHLQADGDGDAQVVPLRGRT